MRYLVKLDGFEGQIIEVEVNGMGKPRLLVNDKLVPVGKRRKMLLQRNDGTEVIATWKAGSIGNMSFGDIPKLVVNGIEIQVVEPLKWYSKTWCCLPLVLVFIGGALGGLLGGLSTMVNFSIFRTSMNRFLKYVLTFVLSLLFGITFLVLASIIHSLWH